MTLQKVVGSFNRYELHVHVWRSGNDKKKVVWFKEELLSNKLNKIYGENYL